jgi:hypothetical protein
MRLRTLASSLVLLALLTGGGSAAGAAPPQALDIGVAPSKLQMRLVPGQTSRTRLDVFNKGDGPAVLDVYFNDYTISTGSVVTFAEAGSQPSSAADWSSLSRRILRMAPHSQRSVELVVRVPEDAAIGTHTLAVVFRTREVQQDGNVRYQPAVASLLAAGVQNADGTGLVMDGTAVVEGIDVRWLSLGDVVAADDTAGAVVDWLIHPTVVAHVEVRNRGNTFFNILKGGTRFRSAIALGGHDGDVRAPTYTILPDSVRTIDAQWTGAPWAARGDAKVRLFYNDNASLNVAPAEYVIVPWHLITVAGLLLALLVGWRITRRVRRDRRRRVRVESPSPWLKAGV